MTYHLSYFLFHNWHDSFQRYTNVYPCEQRYNYYVHKWLYPTGDSRYFLSEQFWNSKFLKLCKACGRHVDYIKAGIEADAPENSMSVVQCNWKIKRCAKLYQRETLSNIQSCNCNLRMNGSEQKSTTMSILKSIWTCIWGLNLWSGILRHLRNKNYLFQDDYETVYSSNATKLWKTEYKIEFLTWPSQSQDMNMIKNVRKIIKLSIQKDIQNIYNRNGLSQS